MHHFYSIHNMCHIVRWTSKKIKLLLKTQVPHQQEEDGTGDKKKNPGLKQSEEEHSTSDKPPKERGSTKRAHAPTRPKTLQTVWHKQYLKVYCTCYQERIKRKEEERETAATLFEVWKRSHARFRTKNRVTRHFLYYARAFVATP